MAKFTLSRAINMHWRGHDLIGEAGDVLRIDDSLREEFLQDFVSGKTGTDVPGLAWTEADEIASASGGTTAHPDLAAHDLMGLIDSTHLTTGHVHNHDSSYASLVHSHAESAITALVTDLAGKAASSHAHADADIPASIARDAEIAAAYSTIGHTHPGGAQAFPVGAVFIAVTSTDPATLLGYGTWVAFGAGQMLVGLDVSQAAFSTPEGTGGAATHAHSFTQPSDHAAQAHSGTAVGTSGAGSSHSHTVTQTAFITSKFTTSNSGTAAHTGGGVVSTPTGTEAAHTHAAGTVTQPASHAALSHTGGAVVDGSSLPPYIVVYLWKRTA